MTAYSILLVSAQATPKSIRLWALFFSVLILSFFFRLSSIFSRVLYAYVCLRVCVCRLCMTWCVYVSLLLAVCVCLWYEVEWCQWWRHETSPSSLSSSSVAVVVLLTYIYSFHLCALASRSVDIWNCVEYVNRIALSHLKIPTHGFAIRITIVCCCGFFFNFVAFNHIF